MFWTIVGAILFIRALPYILLGILWLLSFIFEGVGKRYENHIKKRYREHKNAAQWIIYWVTCISWCIIIYLIIKHYA